MTDVEGSTALWEAAPERMRSAIGRHDDIAAAVVATYGGRLVKARGEGDSLFAVFDDAEPAVRAAIGLHDGLRAESWATERPLRVRAAVHTGFVAQVGDDYYGSPINLTARIRAVTHAGQTIVSQPVAEAVSAAGDLEVRTLGLHTLKDITGRHELYDVQRAGSWVDFPPLSTTATSTSLPRARTPLLGRHRLRAQLRDELTTARLVTLTGPGGAGKTRLALALAADEAGRRPGGVFFLGLAALRRGADLALALCTAAEIDPTPDPRTALIERFGRERVLLVIDNCEHVLDATAELVDPLLEQCPATVVLATSQERLDLPGERVIRVPPLDVPDTDVASLDALRSSEAGALLLAAAERVGVSLGEQDVPAAVDLCRRLDGLPLALELAGARLDELTVTQLLHELGTTLAVLDRPRGGEERHRGLTAAVAWSYGLLDARHQLALRRFAVFAGPVPRDFAVEVVADDDLPATEASRAIGQLVRKSMLVTQDDRVGMLDAVRQFARDELDRRAEAEAVILRHADALVSRLRAGFRDWSAFPPDEGTAATYLPIADELLTAIGRTLDAGREIAVDLTGAAILHWAANGEQRLITTWPRRVAEEVTTAPASRRAYLQVSSRRLMLSLSPEIEQLPESLVDDLFADDALTADEAAYGLEMACEVALAAGEAERGLGLAQRALATAAAEDSKVAAANIVARALCGLDRFDEAYDVASRAQASAVGVVPLRYGASNTALLAAISLTTGRVDEALDLFDTARRNIRAYSTDRLLWVAYGAVMYGGALIYAGRREESRAFLDEGLRDYRDRLGPILASQLVRQVAAYLEPDAPRTAAGLVAAADRLSPDEVPAMAPTAMGWLRERLTGVAPDPDIASITDPEALVGVARAHLNAAERASASE